MIDSNAEKIMIERFGKDSLISLATSKNNCPSVRTVNAFYKDSCFYIITYALSNKMKDIEENNKVAISGEWFTAKGIGINLGWFCDLKNEKIALDLKEAFKEWINNGHNNFEDKNTIILCIQLESGVLFSHGTRYDINFHK